MRLNNQGQGRAAVGAAVMALLQDRVTHRTVWKIERYNEDMEGLGLSLEEFQRRFRPYHISEFEGNVLLNEGINNVLTTLLGGGAATAYDNSNARLGVGDSSTAEDATQAGLQGTSTAFQGMEAGYPTYGSSQQIVWRASFGGSAANFAWNEFTVVNAADDTGDNLLRKVSSQGTKTSGQTWVLTLTVTFS